MLLTFVLEPVDEESIPQLILRLPESVGGGSVPPPLHLHNPRRLRLAPHCIVPLIRSVAPVHELHLWGLRLARLLVQEVLFRTHHHGGVLGAEHGQVQGLIRSRAMCPTQLVLPRRLRQLRHHWLLVQVVHILLLLYLPYFLLFINPPLKHLRRLTLHFLRNRTIDIVVEVLLRHQAICESLEFHELIIRPLLIIQLQVKLLLKMRLPRHGSFLCSAAVVPVRETCEESLYELIMTILVLLGFQISVLAVRFWGVDVALIILPQMIEIY